MNITNRFTYADTQLVRDLVASQFPQWAELPVRPVEQSGWDNRTFHLGDAMIVRLPSAREYEVQVEKEQRWLPWLARRLPLPIPTPLALGNPSPAFPFRWSIYRWIDGATALPDRIDDLSMFARDLGRFLGAMHAIDAIGGPAGGPHNFYRGGDLAIYDGETRQAIDLLAHRPETKGALSLWEQACATSWLARPVWVHGDVSAGNLLVRDGRLCAVIDFGSLGVGDPACDLAIAWTTFHGQSRAAFRKQLPLDEATWIRGAAWALWKALIVAAGMCESNAIESEHPWRMIDAILSDPSLESATQ